jgi:hypothetical protein
MTDWTTPRTWSIGELITKSIMDTHVRDNLLALWPYTAAGQIPLSSLSNRLTVLDASGNANKRIAANGTTFELVDDTKYFTVLLNAGVALTSGDDAARVRIPPALNGWRVSYVAASRKSGTGTLTIQLRNVTQAVDILSTRVTVDSGETDSLTAATAAVINTSNDDVATGDQIAIDVDDAGTSTLYAILQFGLVKT